MNAPLVAVRIDAAEAERRIAASRALGRHADAAIDEARAIVETARREARSVAAMARAHEVERGKALHAIAEDTVDRYLDTKKVEAAAEAAARLLRDAGRIRAEFDALTPWLTDFLRDAVTRLVGTLDDDELLSRLVAEGLASQKDARQVVIRVAPKDIERLEAARSVHPLRFAGVAEIRADGCLKPGAVLLEGPGGVLEAGLETQLDILCRELEALE